MLNAAEFIQDQKDSHKEADFYLIQFPESYNIEEKLQELQKQNPEYILACEKENFLKITESSFILQEYGYFGIKVPGFTSEMFEELHEINDEINFEFDDKEEIFIKMGTFAFISFLTAAIISSLFAWARHRNNGKVYSENGEYELNDPERPGKKLRRIPDVSFLSYESVSEEEQENWDGFIPVPSNLVIEIVSAKRGLKGDLNKMKDIWMANGAEVGIVICPFTETLYIFEKGESNFRTQSIDSEFTHSLLPGYSENFGKYLKKRGNGKL